MFKTTREAWEILIKEHNKAYAEGDWEKVDALWIAIESVKKDMPIKPNAIEHRELVGPDPYRTMLVEIFTCPACGEKIAYREHVKRCLECGQLIDWIK